jgi:mannosyltransferase PIG-V
MNPESAEMLPLDAPGEITLPSRAPLRRSDRSGWPSRLRADDERMTAVRDSWRALWTSRLLVWAAGLGVVFATGLGPVRTAFDPPGVTGGFGWLADRLVAPGARWDSAWYLVVAQHGYRLDLGLATAPRDAFFPLYPLAISALGRLGAPLIVAGVLVSVAALAVALYLLHRLTTLELTAAHAWAPAGPATTARLAVMATAFFPMAFFFSAVYSESLYLALSIGVFWCARNGRWAAAGALGALAAATRSAGIVLLLPVAMLYLYGPREDRPPDNPLARGLRLRYRVAPDALWLGLIPAGLGLYMVYLAVAGGNPLMPFHAQEVWTRDFAGPFGGAWKGAVAALAGVRQLLSMHSRPLYFPAAGGSPFVNAEHNLFLFAFLVAAIPATVGVLRGLPPAYGAYVIAALALPLSYPVTEQPLMSLPRFLAVLFPLNIWVGARLGARRRARAPVLALSALLLAVSAAQFATWHWVA